MLSRVRASKEIQWYFSIIPCDQSTKSYLPGVSTYFPFTVTSFKVAVCHFVQAEVTGISGLSFSTISSTFLRKISIYLFGWINQYFSDTNYYISEKHTGCDLAAIHFRNKQVIYYYNQTSNIFSLFSWINRASSRTSGGLRFLRLAEFVTYNRAAIGGPSKRQPMNSLVSSFISSTCYAQTPFARYWRAIKAAANEITLQSYRTNPQGHQVDV